MTVARHIFKPATVRHDYANLVLLPILGCLTVAGLAGLWDPVQVTYAFTAYTLLDMAWIAVEPEAVPSKPTLILVHHAFTLLLLCIPLRFPHLAIYTCWDGCVEINTLFLIARRAVPRHYRLFNALYWVCLRGAACRRVLLFPALLPWFWAEMRPYPWYDQAIVVGAQLFLCGFNVWFLVVSFRRQR
eukprot:scaffold2.g7069.t1